MDVGEALGMRSPTLESASASASVSPVLIMLFIVAMLIMLGMGVIHSCGQPVPVGDDASFSWSSHHKYSSIAFRIVGCGRDGAV